MKQIPETENALVLRTDFLDDAAWEAVGAAIKAPRMFRAKVHFLSDREFEGVTVEQLPALLRKNSNHTFIFIVDHETLAKPDQPILVVDLYTEPGRTFRVIPSSMWSIENNLSIANMDFEEFAESVDEDGVFRGFPES